MDVRLQVIIGMAKSCLNFKGAKHPKIELDLIKLMYTTQNLKLQGKKVKAYLLVSPPNVHRINHWIKKYNFNNKSNDLEIISFESIDKMEVILKEKLNNAEALQHGVSNKKGIADESKKVFEEYLCNYIKIQHNVEPSTNRAYLGVKWDFCYIKN